MNRDLRQQQIVDNWIKKDYSSGLEAITGFGKTRCSIMAIRQSNAKSTIVIVPTKNLQDQWIKELKKYKISNFKVYVVNTAYKLKLECDLIILDEAHNTASAEQFSLCWKNAKYNKLFWLSATIFRKDDYQKELLKVAPISDTVTFEEALSAGWISNYTMYNVGIEFTSLEKEQYHKLDIELDELIKEIGFLEGESEQEGFDYIKKNIFKLANKYLKTKDWKYIKLGTKYYSIISKRKKLLYNADNKLERTYSYIIKNPDKTVLIFSQSQDFADKLQNKLKDIAVTIHSKIKPKLRESNLKKFKDKRTKIRCIISVKALNEGISIDNIDVGICVAGTSSKIAAVQMLGRILRLYKDKHALFFNLYIKDSQDAIWLRNRTYDLPKNKIKWI